MRVDGDERIVPSAASESVGTRVESALHRRACRRAEPSVLAAVRCLVGRLVIARLPLLIRIVADEEVPGETLVFGRLGVVCGHSVVDIGTF